MEIRTTFHKRLRGIQDDIVAMGSMVEKAISRSIEALKNRDLNMARSIIDDDQKINSKRFEIEENCIQCLFCWIYCPDSAVLVKDEKMIGYDYDHCKGCGVCAMECPGKKGNKAIVMEEEGK